MAEPSWRAVMLEHPEVWGAQQVTSVLVTMRIVVKTAPLRQWEVEREMRARVKAVTLTAGLHPLRVDFFANTGLAGLILSWSGPRIAKQVVPADHLVHATAAVRTSSLG